MVVPRLDRELIRKKERPRPLCPLDDGRGQGRERQVAPVWVGVCDLACAPRSLRWDVGRTWWYVDERVVESVPPRGIVPVERYAVPVAGGVTFVAIRGGVPLIESLQLVLRAWQRSPAPPGGCRSTGLAIRVPIRGPERRSQDPFRVIPNAPGGWCLAALQHQCLTAVCPPSRWNYLSHARAYLGTANCTRNRRWPPSAVSSNAVRGTTPTAADVPARDRCVGGAAARSTSYTAARTEIPRWKT